MLERGEKQEETTLNQQIEPSNCFIKLCRNLSKPDNNYVNSTECQLECSRRFSVQACNVLNELRNNNQLCDATIKCDDGTEFIVHRAILSASSRYFCALFTNGMNDTFNKTTLIKEVDSEIMKHLIG